MKNLKTKALVAGLLAGTLTFVGCKSDSTMDRPDSTTPPATDTTTPSTEGTSTGTTTTPGTGGSGTETRPSDDNLRMPEEDPLRTPENESIRDSEAEPGIHHNGDLGPGTGGSGLDNSTTDGDGLNEGGNIDNNNRLPESSTDPALSPNDPSVQGDLDVPEGAR
ncbi:hypothetical protein [Stigmatella aurantiaca]|uniref:Lipoprotein n=1 Tax=Stigmatella aurantiaca (strain DW4/3-1) TaxID=378806 RepID=Q097L5_STIAD|nr:hypothetical protein [Stigmatella aurantiaca]ADO75750.1 uncharacterized protein STAUR_7995 [Stigmatella aurantiaca DW4/3-1]EAU67946.1 hypothetical protein STIAU_3415 [Stigmatella aurantiaca DW4/3-1]